MGCYPEQSHSWVCHLNVNLWFTTLQTNDKLCDLELMVCLEELKLGLDDIPSQTAEQISIKMLREEQNIHDLLFGSPHVLIISPKILSSFFSEMQL